MRIVGGGICTSTQSIEVRKEVYKMKLEEALTKIAEGLENIEDYGEEFDFIRGLEKEKTKIEETEEYKNLDEKYNELKEKYKKRFIESLTKPLEDNDDDKPDDNDDDVEEVKIEDLDLTGIND